jgi:hypothetical protein
MHEDDRLFADLDDIATISSDTDDGGDIESTLANTLVDDSGDIADPADVVHEDVADPEDAAIIPDPDDADPGDVADPEDAAIIPDPDDADPGDVADPDDADPLFLNGSCMEPADCDLMPPPPMPCKKIRFLDTRPPWGCRTKWFAMFQI